MGCRYRVLIVVLAFDLPGLYIQGCPRALCLQNLGNVLLCPRPDVAVLCEERHPSVQPPSPEILHGQMQLLGSRGCFSGDYTSF